MRCPGKEAIEAHFMSAVKEVNIYQNYDCNDQWHYSSFTYRIHLTIIMVL